MVMVMVICPWRPASSSMSAGIGSSTPATLDRISGKNNGWMENWLDKRRHLKTSTVRNCDV